MLCFVLLFAVAFAEDTSLPIKYGGNVRVSWATGTYTEDNTHEGDCIKSCTEGRCISTKKVKKDSETYKEYCNEGCKKKAVLYETKIYDNDNCKDDPIYVSISQEDETEGEHLNYKWSTPKHVAIEIECSNEDCTEKDDDFKHRSHNGKVKFYMEGKYGTSENLASEWVVEGNALYQYTYVNGVKTRIDTSKKECGNPDKRGVYLECGAMSVFVSIVAMIALFLF